MSAIIIFAIGSPQAFISQARRTQDLYQGSLILSYLASKAVEEATKGEGVTLLYPPVEQKESIPNQLVMRYEGDHSAAKAHAEKIQGAVERAWLQISANTLAYFLRFVATKDHAQVKTIWERQAREWLKCYWTVTEEANSLQYAEQLRQATLDLARRKMFRDFEPIDEHGRKCSITGEHEILHDAQWDGRTLWEAVRDNQRNLSLVGEHERLSAISTIKRFAHEKNINPELVIHHRFPSTSSIAAATFKHGVIAKLLVPGSDDLRSAVSAYLDELTACFANDKALLFTKDGKPNPEYFGKIDQLLESSQTNDPLIQEFLSVDGDFLFEDTLSMPTITEYGGQATANQVTYAKQALAKLIKTAKGHGIPRPQPYLVILSMDGDMMGKTLGDLKGQAEHMRFSQTAAEFAQDDVKRIVEIEHLGRVVYAGGDDVLALLPIKDALEVANQLRVAFADRMTGAGIETHKGDVVQVTASTGLAYVHHTHPLQDAVTKARNAQMIAKEHHKRNALAIHFLRRSGEPRTMGNKWDIPNATPSQVVEAANTLIQAFQEEGNLSRSIPYDVSQIIYSMVGTDVPIDAQEAELKRILKRRTHTLSADLTAKLLNAFKTLRTIDGDNTKKEGWDNLQHWLELTRFIAQEET